MIWTKLNFGKHRGKTLPQVLFSDADWFFWAIEEEVFSNRPQLLKEAMDLDKKARNILIPSKYGDDAIVQYLIHPPTGKFGDMHIVKKSQTPHEGSSIVFYSKRIDMSSGNLRIPVKLTTCSV